MEEGWKWREAERDGLINVNRQCKIGVNIDLLTRRGKEYEKVVSGFDTIPSVDRV